MQKLAIISLSLFAACISPMRSPAQSGQSEVETSPLQYGKPFTKVPDTRDITLYQVNMRTFGKQGNFAGVLARLDSIKALGINVIYLMPVYPVGQLHSVNSPYCIKDYEAVNPEFGTLADLRNLIAGAHNRNMAVLLDWVANHTSYDNHWTKNKSWYLQDSGGNIISPPGTGWNDVAQLDFKSADMRLAMIHAMKYWIMAANADGFRCDYADGPPTDFWKQAIDTLRSIPGHKLLLMAEGTKSELYQAGFDFNFGFRFFEDLKKIYAQNRSVLSIDSLNVSDYTGASEGQRMIRYTTNHDVNGSDGTPLDLFGGKEGSMAAFIVAAYMKSVPMIYNGQEVGTPYRLTFPFTSKKIDWTINPDITAEYKKIIAFRNSSAPIRRGRLESYSSDDVCSFTKQQGDAKVLVIVNVRNKVVEYTMPEALKKGSWKKVMGNSTVTSSGRIDLQPYAYLVLKNR